MLEMLLPYNSSSQTEPRWKPEEEVSLDGSRMVNPCLKKMEVRFTDLVKSVSLVEKDDFMRVARNTLFFNGTDRYIGTTCCRSD